MLLATALLMALVCRGRGRRDIRDAGYDAHGEGGSGFGKEFMPPLNERRQFALHAGAVAEDEPHGNPARDGVAGSGDGRAGDRDGRGQSLGRFETPTDPAPTGNAGDDHHAEAGVDFHKSHGARFIKLPRVVRNPAWREGMTVEKLKAGADREDEGRAGLRAGVLAADREPHPDALHRHPRARSA